MKSTRALLPMAAVAALLLVGCSNGNANDPKGVSDCLPEGKASHSVQVEGEFGEALTLTSKTPVQPKGLERTVIIPGKGVAPQKDQEVTIALTFFSGKDGAVLQHGEPEVVAKPADRADGSRPVDHDAVANHRRAHPGAADRPVPGVDGGEHDVAGPQVHPEADGALGRRRLAGAHLAGEPGEGGRGGGHRDQPRQIVT